MQDKINTNIIYQSPPNFAWWFKLVIFAVILLTFIPAVIMLIMSNTSDGLIMLLVTLLDALLFYIIIPRNYEIRQDKAVIKLGLNTKIKISFDTLKNVRNVPDSYALIYWGLRLATRTSGVIELRRSGGFDVVISPSNPEIFLEQLQKALTEYKKNSS